ncbi:hypothetical protein GGD56_003221 [Rhizobium mongolense]|uniref:Uncharacterized protein n=1 Tax=Rhizobium mongolense TaxID=57676 RepID=A0ABR6INV4_9HYPH|nr:hypothetical protein [Rhizobium mongolense]
MYESLQKLKVKGSADQARAQLNKTRADVLENAFRRGPVRQAQFEVSREFKQDMSRGWSGVRKTIISRKKRESSLPKGSRSFPASGTTQDPERTIDEVRASLR